MPRKTFITDLQDACQRSSIDNISDVIAGEDDGELAFVYHPGPEKSSGVEISALIFPDLHNYPRDHHFQVFTNDNAPVSVARALEKAPSFYGMPLLEFLGKLSHHLDKRSTLETRDELQQVNADDAPEDSDGEAVDNQDWALEEDEFTQFHESKGPNQTLANARARADLKSLKTAGFRIGFLGNLAHGCNCYLSVACRIQKLGISEEAMEAWHVDPSDYLMLLLHFAHGYNSLDFFQSVDSATARSRVSMRVGISNIYKVTSLSEAKTAFKNNPDEIDRKTWTVATECEEGRFGFRETFISRPLNDLLNERLLDILRYRLEFGLSWAGAERRYIKIMSTPGLCSDYSDNHEIHEQNLPSLPVIVSADQISTAKNRQELSLPLLAMQFLLRRFVRCTEFCLVCHDTLFGQIEAIKPYVCDNPLCLYQYMSLGFGPSIEHEVVTQPFVVDLLVSFCFSAAAAYSLRHFPEGLSFRVPHPSLYSEPQLTSLSSSHTKRDQSPNLPPVKKAKTADVSLEVTSPVDCKCRLKQSPYELLFEKDAYATCPLRKGDWIVISFASTESRLHCRVSETHLFPSVSLNVPIHADKDSATAEEGFSTPTSAHWLAVEVYVYRYNFDELGQRDKCSAITMLLDLLPSVDEMQKYLWRNSGTSLALWVDRMSPAALGLLRWIIASNRSCIMQVDQPKGNSAAQFKRHAEDRVQGIPQWLQFRFAMGAPDKEQRFINALAERSDSQFKSIFAWHGSPLHNWHSIIREGLHFDRVAHGRSWGNGCYHARDFHTSVGYSSMHRHPPSSQAQSGAWPKSLLQMSSAVALSEIVNAPHDFVSQHPFYVVSQLEWIQTRYLFVRPCTDDLLIEEDKPLAKFLQQDPSRTPLGPNSTPIVLPITAIAKSRRPNDPGNKLTADFASSSRLHRLKQRLSHSLRADGLESCNAGGLNADDDCESVDTEPEDLEMLFGPDDGPFAASRSQPERRPDASSTDAVTNFVACPISNLPRMPSPKYATTSASKRLLKDFRTLQSTQASHIRTHSLPSLGWYSDPEHMEKTENLYQWIVELHSFPLSLPLATDMKKAGVQSIVLEIRFHATYPFSPPFVRVVRPRFVPFQQGGGGHVTAGGSICMDLLTSSGWTVVSDIESVLLQIRMAIMSTDPRPARLQSTNSISGTCGSDYRVAEAIDAFKRAARAHGWAIPEALDEMGVSSGTNG